MIMKGFKFKMVNSGDMIGDVVGIRYGIDQVDIVLTPSDGNAFQVTWALSHLQNNLVDEKYKTRPYKAIEPNSANDYLDRIII